MFVILVIVIELFQVMRSIVKNTKYYMKQIVKKNISTIKNIEEIKRNNHFIIQNSGKD
ncbi:hypothetical protein KM803_13130 [Clostridium tyrobutyricum]|jgi:hypothetical protein|uniref:hypothetical protein n=1 Tax=Clostridium tyrobutyricum TaxID=1519 RepID=UPI001AD7FFA1|nr:hypothetical protein [Clostridium tyrobutyricum]MBV4432261.1 hypothetical protein [Clostridium tyrobutyricum]